MTYIFSIHFYRVILACKDKEDEGTKSVLLEYCELDMSSFASVKKFAKNISEKEKNLDILVFCGGSEESDKTITEDGQELVFQVNHLSPFLLTNLLLILLQASESSR